MEKVILPIDTKAQSFATATMNNENNYELLKKNLEKEYDERYERILQSEKNSAYKRGFCEGEKLESERNKKIYARLNAELEEKAKKLNELMKELGEYQSSYSQIIRKQCIELVNKIVFSILYESKQNGELVASIIERMLPSEKDFREIRIECSVHDFEMVKECVMGINDFDARVLSCDSLANGEFRLFNRDSVSSLNLESYFSDMWSDMSEKFESQSNA